MRDAYSQYLTSTTEPENESQFLDDISYTLCSKRTHHAWRSFSVAASRETLQKSLAELPKSLRAKSDAQMAFVFTGQGAQWPTMGMELMVYPAFRQSIFAADKYLNEIGCPWSLTCTWIYAFFPLRCLEHTYFCVLITSIFLLPLRRTLQAPRNCGALGTGG